MIWRILRILHIMLKGNVGEVLHITLRIVHTMMRGNMYVYVYAILCVKAVQGKKNRPPSFPQGARLPGCLRSEGLSSGERHWEGRAMWWLPWWTRVSWRGACWAADMAHSSATPPCSTHKCLFATLTTGGKTSTPRSVQRTDPSSHRSVSSTEK